MGIETVAVYSDADAELPYVQAATKARRIGEPPVQKSYLNVEELLRISHEEKVDAIHPGYGFYRKIVHLLKERLMKVLFYRSFSRNHFDDGRQNCRPRCDERSGCTCCPRQRR